jgi:hypothetical protein
MYRALWAVYLYKESEETEEESDKQAIDQDPAFGIG